MPTSTSSVEISNLTPALRADLRFSLQKYGDESCYLIEDEKNTRFYRIGTAEYTFISLMDGTTSIREAMAHTAGLLGNEAFTEHDAICICKWLVESDLAQTEASTDKQRLANAVREVRRRQWFERSNPLFLRVPLLRPDRTLTQLEGWLGWWISWPAFVLWVGTLTFAIHQILTHWSTVTAPAIPTFAPQNLLWMTVVWCVLKFFHELGHGLACKRFGSHVREAGLMFILFAPIPYVDVTSAWKIPSKWKRIFISFAGIYTELSFAAIAAIIWIHTAPGTLNQQAYNVMLTGSVITLFFNANPLMRFDGYYMLSDWCEIPNLYAAGQQAVSTFARRYLLGIKLRPQRLPGHRQTLVNFYGTLAFAWRQLVTFGILLAASTLFHGAGIALAIAGGLICLGLPLIRLVPYLLYGNQRERPNRGRLLASMALIGAILLCVGLAPEPGGVRAPGIVQYDPLHVVRAPYAGFLKEVHTHSGADVVADQLLLVIENPELQHELATLKLEREQTLQRERIFREDGDIAAVQIEVELRQSLDARIQEISTQLASSRILAPATGQITTREVQPLVGTYVEEGEELVAIGSEEEKRVALSIDQLDRTSFEGVCGSQVQLAFLTPGSATLRSRLTHVNPRASLVLLDHALGATHGGPLTVQQVEEEGAVEEWELVEPRFRGEVELTPRQSRSLRVGQRATVRLNHSRGTIAGLVFRGTRDWIEQKLKRLQSS